jgi:dTDP-glucose 4,6-dehydratase
MQATIFRPEDDHAILQDLHSVHDACWEVFHQLRDARIFLTGGTGFIGCWLLESLRYADCAQKLGLHITVLTRDFSAFQAKAPHLANYPGFSFMEGDVCDFQAPAGEFSHLVHAATDASANLNEKNPLKMFDTILQGTRRALDFAVKKGVKRTLFLSSGAVYGVQPWEMEHVAEGWLGGPNYLDSRATYAEGKRAAEMLCAIYRKQFGANITIARIFSLLGPYLSLDTHFAAGNFIRDAIQGKKIVVNGNGLPCRSYLYASDLTVWLWHLLARGADGVPYNVGSDVSTSVRDLAETVSDTLGNVGFDVIGAPDKGWNLGRYVPDVSRVAQELGLHQTVGLQEAILRTARWNGWRGRHL